MKSAEKLLLDAAKTELRSWLERLLGPNMRGVSGYGAGLDGKTHEFGLNVLVDSRIGRANKVLEQKLPPTIGGFPVRITAGGLGRLD